MENKVPPKSTSEEKVQDTWKDVKGCFFACLFCCALFVLLVGIIVVGVIKVSKEAEEQEKRAVTIVIQSMDFTVLDVTKTHNVRWEILIRIPSGLPGYSMCLHGDFQVFILYNGVTIASSPKQSYDLVPRWGNQLYVSMDGVISKDIMEVIKNQGELRFGSRVVVPDCRLGSRGKMDFACDKATLRFRPGSQTSATLSGNYPDCLYVY